MTDFRTPLPVHRAAFVRVGAHLAMPDEGKEAVRKAFQAGDRAGRPFAEIARAVGEAAGEYLWEWPWWETCARDMVTDGFVPLAWQEEHLVPPFAWAAIPHNARARLLTLTMSTALQTERALADLRKLEKGPLKHGLELMVGNKNCAASASMLAAHAPHIQAGSHARLPPFFPGDECYVRVGRGR